MARRKEAHAANHERWLVSYADFITLLFAFFVVMFASSQVDQRKVGKLAMAIQVAFQQLGVFPSSNTKPPMNTASSLPFSEVQGIESIVPHTQAIGRIAPEMQGSPGISSGVPNLHQLQTQLEKVLAPELQKQAIAIRSHGGELVISLRELGFFDSGSAKLRPDAEDPLTRLAGVLVHQPYMLRIEGHTDSIPIHNSQFASNWELSTARATEIISLFISRYGFSPERLSAAGYAQYHPIASNETAEGRSHNRRVDIVIATPLHTPFPGNGSAASFPTELGKKSAPSEPASAQTIVSTGSFSAKEPGPAGRNN